MLVLLALVLQLVVAKHSNCSRSLQEALFQPRTFSKEYLEKVAVKFKSGAELLFTSQAGDYVTQFEQEWNVNVVISDPSKICGQQALTQCIEFGETGISASIGAGNAIQLLYTFPEPIPYPISRVQVSLLSGFYVQAAEPFFSASLAGPEGSFNKLLNYTNCTSNTFQFSLSDSSSEPLTNDTCSAFNLTPPFSYAPVQSFSAAYVGKALLYDSWGLTVVNLAGSETVTITDWVVEACYEQPVTSCSSDTMHSLLNIPGFRIDSGIAYYTEEIHSADGQLRIVTISRSIEGL